MNITPATLEDSESIAAVHVRSWQAAYAGILKPEFLAQLSVQQRAERWRDILQKAESQVLVARSESGVVGFVNLGRCRDEGASSDQGEIWALYAQPEVWGQGVGRALLQRAIHELRALGLSTVSLWVLSRNQRGVRFYEACGFKEVPGSAKLFELGGSQVEEVALRLQPDA